MPHRSEGFSRRALLASGLAAAAWPASAAQVSAFERQARALEARAGGRLGFWGNQLGGDNLFGWRENERFRMCSTFKSLAVAAVLARVDRGHERLERWIPYGPSDLQPYAPVTKANLAKGGMTLGDLCAAAIELSDNTAANLILASIGGPSGVTQLARSLGDKVTRLDRTEPELNRGAPGDPRDTTSPAAMVGLWERLLLRDGLSQTSQTRLTDWLEACKTGSGRLPAATPKGWVVGHKTGSGATTIGDVAVFTNPLLSSWPVMMAVYLDAPPSDAHDAIIADVGRLLLKSIVGEAAA